MATFFYEDGQENLFNELGEKVYDPMEDVLTQIDDPNIVLETITNRETYLNAKRPEKVTSEPAVKKQLKSSNLTKSAKSYNLYSDMTRETFIDRMIEQPQERGLVAKVARELNVKYRTALNWWHIYEETEGVPYKKSEQNSGRKSSFTTEHNEYVTKLLDNDPQLYADDIINSLTEQFEGFTISKSQMNNHLRNTMLITIKKPYFEPEVRNSVENLQTRFEWFMKWKDSDMDFTKNCIFIDEAGFHINMRLNWARSKSGKKAVVKQPQTRAPTHTIIGAIHSSSIMHVAVRKPPPRKEIEAAKKKRKANNGKKRAATEISREDVEVYDDSADNKPVKKGTTTAHFVKFMNELLAVMDAEEVFKGSYIVLDNASIHKSKPMLRKIESKGYKVMYLPPYSPELNPIEQFWAVVKGKMKRDRLMNEENLSSRITDACNDISVSDLYGFCNHSKHQIINCYNKTQF